MEDMGKKKKCRGNSLPLCLQRTGGIYLSDRGDIPEWRKTKT